MKQQVEEARFVLAAEQAAIEPLDLGTDARQTSERTKQRIEERRAHREPCAGRH
jgi:hypothetical protein